MHPGAPRDRSPEGSGSEEAGARPAKWVQSSALGIQVVLVFAVLVYAGSWVDGKYGFEPWGTLAGIALGIVSIFTAFLREAGLLKSVAEKEAEARAHEERSDDGASGHE